MINVKPAPATIIHISFRAELACSEDTKLDSDDALDTAIVVKKLPKERRCDGVKGHAHGYSYFTCSALRGGHNFQRYSID